MRKIDPSEHSPQVRTAASADVDSVRRRLVIAGLALPLAACGERHYRILPGDRLATCEAPRNFPPNVPLYQQGFENWSGEIVIDDLWTCSPRDAADVLTVADWARDQGYRLRAIGSSHNWSPIHVTGDTDCRDRVILLSTRESLTAMSLEPGMPAAVRTQPGALMEDLLGFLENHGYGITNVPAPGGLTVGGVLAIDGHGAAIPANGESTEPGKTFGSISNRVLEISVVQWDASLQRHVEVTYARDDPATAALLVNLGRVFVTQVLLTVAADVNLRCVSRTDIPAAELFADPALAGAQAFTRFLNDHGRAEAIWFPFTDYPWFKYWAVTPTRPVTSREVTQPYNYPFSDNYPAPVTDLINRIVTGEPSAAMEMGPAMFAATVAGLVATASADIWGPSKNTLLYVKATTLRAAVNGYGVLTSRNNIQNVLHRFFRKHSDMLAAYAQRGEYPINLATEIRCSGLDIADQTGPGAEPPALSALKPDPDHPDWDVVVWFNVLSLTGTPGQYAYYTDMESWFMQTFDGTDAHARVEWSKGWAYAPTTGPWTSDGFLSSKFRADYPSTGGRKGLDWAAAVLDRIDPHRIFSNRFIDRLI